MSDCSEALAEMCRLLNEYGDPLLGIAPSDMDKPYVPRIQPLRVTRRGNVYDDTLQRSVLHTWGMGNIRERNAIAEKWIEENYGRT